MSDRFQVYFQRSSNLNGSCWVFTLHNGDETRTVKIGSLDPVVDQLTDAVNQIWELAVSADDR